ncbi:MAG: hypothetical protein AAGC43_12095 [Bacteroidota bacterium]
MKSLYLILRLTVLFLLIVSCREKDENKNTKDLTIIEPNQFGKANVDANPKLLEYGQLVGEWDIIFSSRVNDSTWADSKAYWRFEYILDGFAIQDYWINYADKGKNPNARDLHGTNLRIYNPSLKEWQCVWIENGTCSIAEVWRSYGNDKGEILLLDNKNTWVITFYNITNRTFDWKWDFYQPDGSLRTNYTIRANRRR